MKVSFSVSVACAVVISTWGQDAGKPLPRFEDYGVKAIFRGIAANPHLTTPEERKFRTVIRNGVSKGWGAEDGITGKELAGPGPNFAGHYTIVTWGCGSPCLMAAIVDLKTGRVYPPPFDRGPGHRYFQVPWAFPMEPPLEYRLNSRLLVARICEEDKMVRVGGHISYQANGCGAHYFLMEKGGLKLIRRVLEE